MEKKDDQFEEFFKTLPQKHACGSLFAQYKGFWFDGAFLHGVITFYNHFEAHNSDIILATIPKAGTTWLKALTFSIVNRKKYSIPDSPLLFNNPHLLVPFLEASLYNKGKVPNVKSIPSPRIFATHIPLQCLPNTILGNSSCRIIYLCRNPLDLFTSSIHFLIQNGLFPQEPESMDGAFESFCEGIFQYGPFWDHMLGYWEASIKDSNKVLFLKYEDLKRDINSFVKKIAEFMGYGFSQLEEDEGMVEQVAKLCSLETLKYLDCNNKGGSSHSVIKVAFRSFFRKGKVGDWANFLTPTMAKRLEDLMKEKFKDTGLTLTIHD
ncbi:OLC1v1009176C1 [Oldenlandia corymbosa var. corymbosa]|uniref:Sulfotransferase n=1 Tax=Oldenlandia corymbosa var. corymbosa TaxID=529605 RepID=A0AAV1DNC6_OLDCO|nr:OLC1v1009176C1 [Oldenlandia corymbosa var. corymbosa]